MAFANGPGDLLSSAKTSFRPTDAQARAKTRLRKWKRNRSRWEKLPTFRGKRYLELVGLGRAHPYRLDPTLRRDLLSVASPRAVELLEHVIACERAFNAHGGAVLSHETSAELLGCSRRTAGDAMRELQELELVEMRPWFVTLGPDEESDGTKLTRMQKASVDFCGGRGKHKHREVTPRYVTTKRCRELLEASRKKEVGKKCQPSGDSASLSETRKVTRGRGRPGERFANRVRWMRQDASLNARLAPREKARVVKRHRDGRVELGSPLHGDPDLLLKKAVANRRPSPETVDASAGLACPEVAWAWAAFEEKHGAQS